MQVLSIYKHTLSFDPFKQQNHKNVCNKTTHPHGPKAPAGWPIHVEGSVSNPQSVNYCDKLITFCITGALKKRILHAHFLYTFNDYNNADHKVVHVMHCRQKKCLHIRIISTSIPENKGRSTGLHMASRLHNIRETHFQWAPSGTMLESRSLTCWG